MKQNDTTPHLWFRPISGILTEADVAFVERYSKRFHPRAMNAMSHALHRMVANITGRCEADKFAYQLSHYTFNANKRYVLEESLRDPSHENGLSVGIQGTTHEERALFRACFDQEDGATTLQSVQGVKAYLEDSLRMESHKWEHAKLHNGEDALPVVKDIIAFLDAVKSAARVYSFSFTDSKEGMVLSLALVTPGVIAYYTRIDWTIV